MKPIRSICIVAALAATLGTACVRAQELTSTLEQSSVPDTQTPRIYPTDPNSPNDQEGKQPKRILGIIPNYRAVSANTHLPPQSFKEKFWLATEDTFDYSDVIFVGGLAGISMAQKTDACAFL